MYNKNLKIIFFGDTEFSEPSRRALVQSGYNLTTIGKKDASLKDEKFFEYFKKLNPDLCVVADYGRLIPVRYLEIPKYGFINTHPSLLPKYRGPSPIQTAIMNGDGETGVTIMRVDKEMDHGKIVVSSRYQVAREKNYKEIEKELAELGAQLLIEILPKYISEEIKLQEQDHSQATFTKIINREDGRIDWGQPAEKIYNRVRALSHEPGTWTTWKGKILNIRTAQVRIDCPTSQDGQSGTVTSVDNQIVVTTGKCYLVLRTVQLEGGKEIDVKSFLNGHRDFLNSKLE